MSFFTNVQHILKGIDVDSLIERVKSLENELQRWKSIGNERLKDINSLKGKNEALKASNTEKTSQGSIQP